MPLWGTHEGDYVEKLGHEYGEWTSNGDGTHSRVCSRNEEHKETVDCSGGTATATERPVCDVCHSEYGSVLGHTHAFTEQKITDKFLASSATCTEKAKYYYSCQCGEKGATTFEYGSLAAHKESDWVIDKEATATEEGSKHTYCTVCEKTLQTATIDKLKAESVGLAYSVNDDDVTCTITGIGTCTDTDLVIPKKIDGYSVTSIWDAAFYGCSSLTSIDIPDSVTSIWDAAFYGCSSLTSIEIPDGVTSIGDSTFRECSCLTSVTIGNSVTSIGDYAFYGCDSLTSIVIPDSVTSIGDDAFYGCDSLTSITVSSGNKVYHSAGNCLIKTADKTLILGCNNSVIPTDGSVTSIEDYAFYGCSSLTSIVIPDSVTSIGYGVFFGCSSLTSVTIGNGVKSIGVHAFHDCSGLTSLVIPDSVTSIGNYAFYSCSSLTSIKIPNSVTSIGDWAFEGCSSLTSVTIGNGVKSIGYGVFSGCSSLTSITFNGTQEQWNAIEKGSNWKYNSLIKTIHCTDGDVTV